MRPVWTGAQAWGATPWLADDDNGRCRSILLTVAPDNPWVAINIEFEKSIMIFETKSKYSFTNAFIEEIDR